MKKRKNYTGRERRIRSERLMYTFAATLAGCLLLASVTNNFGKAPKQGPVAEGEFQKSLIKASVRPN